MTIAKQCDCEEVSPHDRRTRPTTRGAKVTMVYEKNEGSATLMAENANAVQEPCFESIAVASSV